MTRLEFITSALRIVGDTTKTTEGIEWLRDVFTDFEARDLWRFLEQETTYQTETTVDSIALSATKWPSAAITDYSKGLFISSAVAPYGLKYLPQVEFKRMHTNETGNPTTFSIWDDTVWLHPTPVTNFLPLLTVGYFGDIVLPTADGDELSDVTKTGLPKKLHSILMQGVVAKGMAEIKDPRWADWQNLYTQSIELIAKPDNSMYYTDSDENFGRIQIPARANKEESRGLNGV